jgi:hypothetical protein
MPVRRPTRRQAVAVAAALAGAVLFAWAIRDVGWSEVSAGVRRVGWGLVPILLLAGGRFAVRAEAWRQCMPPQIRISFRRAFAAYLAGDAVGNVTPLGLLASEPAKVFLTRHRLATREAASSLALDVFIYSISVVAMIGVGLVALLTTVPLPGGWAAGIAVGMVALAVASAVALRVAAGTWDAGRGPRPAWRARLAGLRESALAFSGGRPWRLWRVFVLHLVFHVLAFLEVFVTLRWLLGDETPTLAQALIFSALDRAVIVLFKFVPFRIGIDEASAGGMAALLGWGAATGVALAIVKKVRGLAWAGVGLLLIAAHPAPAAPAPDRRGTASAHRT